MEEDQTRPSRRKDLPCRIKFSNGDKRIIKNISDFIPKDKQKIGEFFQYTDADKPEPELVQIIGVGLFHDDLFTSDRELKRRRLGIKKNVQSKKNTSKSTNENRTLSNLVYNSKTIFESSNKNNELIQEKLIEENNACIEKRHILSPKRARALIKKRNTVTHRISPINNTTVKTGTKKRSSRIIPVSSSSSSSNEDDDEDNNIRIIEKNHDEIPLLGLSDDEKSGDNSNDSDSTTNLVSDTEEKDSSNSPNNHPREITMEYLDTFFDDNDDDKDENNTNSSKINGGTLQESDQNNNDDNNTEIEPEENVQVKTINVNRLCAELKEAETNSQQVNLLLAALNDVRQISDDKLKLPEFEILAADLSYIKRKSRCSLDMGVCSDKMARLLIRNMLTDSYIMSHSANGTGTNPAINSQLLGAISEFGVAPLGAGKKPGSRSTIDGLFNQLSSRLRRDQKRNMGLYDKTNKQNKKKKIQKKRNNTKRVEISIRK